MLPDQIQGSCAVEELISSLVSPGEIEMVAEVQASGPDRGLRGKGWSESTSAALGLMVEEAETQRLRASKGGTPGPD